MADDATQAYIVDPDDRTKAIHAPSGQMASSFYFAPAGTSVYDKDAWTFIGFMPPSTVGGEFI